MAHIMTLLAGEEELLLQGLPEGSEEAGEMTLCLKGEIQEKPKVGVRILENLVREVVDRLSRYVSLSESDGTVPLSHL